MLCFRRCSAGLAVLLGGLSSLPAAAEEGRAEASGLERGDPRAALGIFVGGVYLSDEVELGNSYFADQVPGSAFLAGLRAAFALVPSMAKGRPVDPRLLLELEGRFAFSRTDAGDTRNSSFAPVLGWRAHAILEVFQHSPVVPFLLAGGGGETVFGSRKYMHIPDTDLAGYGGLGARVPLGARAGLRLDVRAGLTAGREDDVAPLAEVHLGAYFAFGGAGRSRPPLPVAAAPRPLLDRDGDGIPDEGDRCPEEAETLNGIEDEDGCPETDSDGDGLVGDSDRCPAEAEDLDGFEDEDGCPDLDNDADGRPDAADLCPLESETANGYEDEDGCPDEVPEPVARFTGTIRGIQFQVGSARILSSSKPVLDEAVAVLKQYPAIRIEVSGHTDSRGSEAINMELSGKRADYVKWYLVGEGIDAGRVETVAYGPVRPIADNDTADGRAENRRIEFRLLSGPAAAPDAPAALPPAPAEEANTPAPGAES